MNIDLTLFCAPASDRREQLREPFSIDGMTAATDGAIIIFVHGSRPDFPPPPAIYHDTIATMKEAAAIEHPLDDNGWIDAAAHTSPVSDCPWCTPANTAADLIPAWYCDSCDGTGYFEHYYHEYECQACPTLNDGDDPLHCHHCAGIGLDRYQASPIPLALPAGQGVAQYYINLISRLPGAHIRTQPTPAGLVLYRFEGGCGLLMPMRLNT